MKKHPYRALLIWAVIIFSLITIYPTIGWMSLDAEERQARLDAWAAQDEARAAERHGFFEETMFGIRRWAEFDRDRVINLGLDLQGGIHMILGFDIDELPEDRLAEYENQGMSRDEIQEHVQDTVVNQIQMRVDDFEAKEPVIQALGETQVQIQLPGEKDIDRAKRLITKTAKLDFHLAVTGEDTITDVLRRVQEAYPNRFTPFLNPPALPGDPVTFAEEHADRIRAVVEEANATEGLLPENLMLAVSPPPKGYEEQVRQLYVLERKPLQSGEGLTSAMAMPDQENPGFFQILFNLNPDAGAEFRKATSANVNKPMAIVLDKLVLSAPVIRDAIGTSGQISGNFEREEAIDLSIALNSGSMVVPIHEEYTGVVDATLGAESVHKGIVSAIAGVIVVSLFMAVYYLAPGIIALLTLMLNAVFVVAAMAYFDMTLTLPGIAGLILTVGMAVDANVLIYERMREEQRLGHSLISSVENGFSRAAVPILDANVTTLIAAAVLFQFGTGPIEGFAITLSIGVVCSVFSALVVSRAMFDFAVRRNILTSLKMFSIVRPDTNVQFLHWRRPAFAISGVLLVIGMGWFFYRGADMFGVDFTEGTNLRITLDNEEQVSRAQVEDALASAGFAGPIVQEAGEGGEMDFNHFIVRVGESPSDALVTEEIVQEDGEEAATEAAAEETAAEETAVAQADTEQPQSALVGEIVSTRVQEALAPLTAAGSLEAVILEEVQTVGPAVGKQLRRDALKAIIWALFFIVLYVAFRFEMKFAAGAVAALVHDVFLTVGILALLGRQISMPVVAAVLTIIGYSLNDTIVVFDRIREDLTLKRGKGHSYIDVLNSAMNSTLSRTLLTSLTTLFVVLVLFIFGGTAINDFALALIIGVILGTYSTLFIASPVVLIWHRYRESRRDTTTTGREERSRYKKKKKKGAKGEAPAS